MDDTDISDEHERELRELRDEAAIAGDLDQVSLCDRAMTGDRAALAECERVIREARARR